MAVSLVPQMNMEVFRTDYCDAGSFYHSSTTIKLEKGILDSYNCIPETNATYTDLSESIAAPRKQLLSIKTESDMTSWKHRHPENWTQDEVLDWVFYVAQLPEYEFDNTTFKGEVFQNLTGADLCKMSPESFSKLDWEYGEIFYEVFSTMLSGVQFDCGPMLTQSSWDALADCVVSAEADFDRFPNWPSPSPQIFDEAMELTECTSGTMTDGNLSDFSLRVDDESSLRVSVDDGNTWYDIDPDSSRFDLDTVHTVYPPTRTEVEQDLGYSSGVSEYGCGSPDRLRTDSLSSECTLPERRTQNSPARNGLSAWQQSRRRKPSGCEEKKQRGRRTHNSTKGSHLWEFIRDLLKNPETSPSLLRWEDAENGVFRFMQSEQVARKWGEKKNNKKMTYEKLSRAMRFCRTAGYFAEVPKNGKFPKKLCFKFGPKAYGWQTDRNAKGTTTHRGS